MSEEQTKLQELYDSLPEVEDIHPNDTSKGIYGPLFILRRYYKWRGYHFEPAKYFWYRANKKTGGDDFRHWRQF